MDESVGEGGNSYYASLKIIPKTVASEPPETKKKESNGEVPNLLSNPNIQEDRHPSLELAPAFADITPEHLKFIENTELGLLAAFDDPNYEDLASHTADPMVLRLTSDLEQKDMTQNTIMLPNSQIKPGIHDFPGISVPWNGLDPQPAFDSTIVPAIVFSSTNQATEPTGQVSNGAAEKDLFNFQDSTMKSPYRGDAAEVPIYSPLDKNALDLVENESMLHGIGTNAIREFDAGYIPIDSKKIGTEGVNSNIHFSHASKDVIPQAQATLNRVLQSIVLSSIPPAIPESTTTCNCRKECIKRYCPCFAGTGLCSNSCRCANCKNKQYTLDVVLEARANLLARDPDAFNIEAILSQRMYEWRWICNSCEKLKRIKRVYSDCPGN